MRIHYQFGVELIKGFNNNPIRPEKNPWTSAGFEPAKVGSRGEHVTSRPPRSTIGLDTFYRAGILSAHGPSSSPRELF